AQQRITRQQEAVPERQPSVRNGFLDRGAPRQSLEGDVGKDRVAHGRNAVLRREPLPRIPSVIDIGRPIQLASEKSLAREEQWQYGQKGADPPWHKPDEAPGQPQRQRRGAEIRQPQGGNFESQWRDSSPPCSRTISAVSGAALRTNVSLKCHPEPFVLTLS